MILTIAGSTWVNQGTTIAAQVLLVGLGVGLAVLLVIVRASIESGAR